MAGIDEGPAGGILSERGTDMRRGPSGKHWCRWLGLSPPHKIAGGKGLSRRVRPGAQRVAVALRRRLGAPTAITAPAHPLARRRYSLGKHGSAYVTPGREAYESPYRARTVEALARHAKAVGYTLVALGTPAVPRRRRRPDLLRGDNTTPMAPALWGKGGSVFALQHRARHDSRAPCQTVHPHRVSALGGRLRRYATRQRAGPVAAWRVLRHYAPQRVA